MRIPLPKLDVKSFSDFVSQALAIVPAIDKEWTNFNAADPGTTLIELLAYLHDSAMFRLDQVTSKNYLQFLDLLGEQKLLQILKDNPEQLADPAFLNEVVYEGIENINVELVTRNRLISEEDCQIIVERALNEIESNSKSGLLPNPLPKIKQHRVIVLSNRDFDYSSPEKQHEGHLSLIFLAEFEEEFEAEKKRYYMQRYREFIRNYIADKLLITSQVHISPFRNSKIVLSQEIDLRIEVALAPIASWQQVQRDIKERVHEYFSVFTGGEQGTGWPIGRPVYKSEIYEILENLESLDYVEQIELLPSQGGSRADLHESYYVPSYYQYFHINSLTIERLV